MLDGGYRRVFSVMMAVGSALGIFASLFLPDGVGTSWLCGWFGGLLLGAGFGLWAMGY